MRGAGIVRLPRAHASNVDELRLLSRVHAAELSCRLWPYSVGAFQLAAWAWCEPFGRLTTALTHCRSTLVGQPRVCWRVECDSSFA